jgi:hypothetical protein
MPRACMSLSPEVPPGAISTLSDAPGSSPYVSKGDYLLGASRA